MTGQTERYTMALLSCLFTLIPVIVPVSGLILIFSIVAPAPLVVLGAKHPWRYSLAVLGGEIIALFLLQGSGVFFTVFYYGLAPLVMAQAIRLRYTIAQTVMWSVLIPCGLNMLLLVGYSAVAQESPVTVIERTIESLLQVAQERMPLPDTPQSDEPEASEDDVVAIVKSMSQIIVMILPAMMVMNFLFTNVVNYLIVRWYFGRNQPPFMIDPTDLGTWHLADHVVWIFLLSGIMLILPSTLLNVVGWNVFILTLALYLLHGIAITVFWMRRLPLPVSGRWLLVIAAFLFAGPLCIVMWMAAGLFDIWLDFRRQRQEPLNC